MLLLYIDVKPMSLQLAKMPWLSGGCHICFHFSPSGCCKNKFQGRHVPGTCFCYLCWAQFLPVQFQMCQGGSCSHALFRDFRDYLVQRCPALRGLAGIWARGRGEALCSAKLWFMHAGIQLKPEAAPEWDKAQFSLTHSSNPSRAKQNTR